MKRISIISILVLLSGGLCLGQSQTPVFIGLQPNVTVEPFYEQGEFDLDILPLVVEASVGLRTNLKFMPTVNYHFGGESNGISDLGASLVVPVFFKAKETMADRPFGFYLGPVLGFGRNLINDHYTTTVGLEPGYMFATKKRFTISMGLQLGGTYFSYDNEDNKWLSHFGPKFSFGFWIN